MRKGKKKPTTLRDLETVCANCHRMLHRRYTGTRPDMKALRRAVMKAKRASI
jgi:predicted HNH restriction endonuclease